MLDYHSNVTKILLSNKTNNPNLYLSSAKIIHLQNNFPVTIGVDITGLINPDDSTSKARTFSAIIGKGNLDNKDHHILIDPHFLYHNPKFIKSFALCKTEDDMLRGLIKLNYTVSSEQQEVTKNEESSMQIDSVPSTQQDNVDQLSINIGGLTLDDYDMNDQKLVTIKCLHKYKNHAFFERLKLIANKNVTPELDTVQTAIANMLGIKNPINNADTETLENGFDFLVINEDLYNSFVGNEWIRISKKRALSLNEIIIRIHNFEKTSKDDELRLWKSPEFDPDEHKDIYSLKMKVQFTLFIEKSHISNFYICN